MSAAMVALDRSKGMIVEEEMHKQKDDHLLGLKDEEITVMSNYVEKLQKEICNFSGLKDFIHGHASIAEIVGSLDLSSNWSATMAKEEKEGLQQGLVEALKKLKHVDVYLKGEFLCHAIVIIFPTLISSPYFAQLTHLP